MSINATRGIIDTEVTSLEKYKIGTVAKLLDLPDDTLRYYESRGIVTPQKDEESRYRYYDAWDLNFLLDSKWYRSYDFSLNDVVKMINSDDQTAFIDRCIKHEAELLQTIYEYKLKLNSLVKFRQRVAKIKNKLDMIEIVERPPMIYQRMRVDNEFIFDDEALRVMQKWLSLLRSVEHTFFIPNYTISDKSSFNEYWWGFSLSPDDAISNGIDISPPVVYLPPVKSVYTVFTAGSRNTFSLSLKTKVIQKILDMGHKIVDAPVGNLLVRLHEDGEFTRYFEVWVPIE